MNIYTPNGTSIVPTKFINSDFFDAPIDTNSETFKQSKVFMSQTEVFNMCHEIGLQFTDKEFNNFLSSYDNDNTALKQKGINTVGKLGDTSMKINDEELSEEFNGSQIRAVFNLSIRS
jgi:hypothetical protein